MGRKNWALDGSWFQLRKHLAAIVYITYLYMYTHTPTHAQAIIHGCWFIHTVCHPPCPANHCLHHSAISPRHFHPDVRNISPDCPWNHKKISRRSAENQETHIRKSFASNHLNILGRSWECSLQSNQGHEGTRVKIMIHFSYARTMRTHVGPICWGLEIGHTKN